MAAVQFTVHHHFDQEARSVWRELVDWPGHATWIPATRVDVVPGDPHTVGAEFTAWTGFGRLSLEDHMRVAAFEWNAERQHGTCTVDKLGPVLQGTASFTVSAATSGGADLEWVEDVVVPYLPGILAPVASRIGAAGFKLAIKNLARQMTRLK